MWASSVSSTDLQKRTGFTIVELLIVVVVVAILAAITIVAYNGIQTQAKNTAIEQAVAQYRKALIAYAAEYGKYPVDGTVCMGEMADYPNAYPDACYGGSGSSTFASELKKTISPLPSPNKECFTAWGGCRKNFTFYANSAWTIDGESHRYYIIYYIGGGADCSLPTTLEGSYGSFATTTTRGYMERRGSESMCILALPTP